jgi:hypothetical protein
MFNHNSGYTLGNNGNPYGYIYDSPSFGDEVFLNTATFNNGMTTSGVVTKQVNGCNFFEM